jgi:hypothetical protein
VVTGADCRAAPGSAAWQTSSPRRSTGLMVSFALAGLLYQTATAAGIARLASART